MLFTGINTIYLPQKSGFSFALNNINILQNATGSTAFIITDTSGNQITIKLSSGSIYLGPNINKIISTYATNTLNLINITGFYQNNTFNYQINSIFGQSGYNFGQLNTFTVSGSNNPIFCDVYFNSNPINYSLSFTSPYSAGQNLTGIISSDTNFYVNSTSFQFLNSNNYVVLDNLNQSLQITKGNNSFSFQDIDTSLFEYYNNFIITINTSFGNIGGLFQPYKGNIYNQGLININDFSSNNYFIESLFNGIWSGNAFHYVDTPLTYYISYYLQGMNALGYEMPVNLSASFQPAYPLNHSGYTANYVTGFTLTNSGFYSGQIPNTIFSEYYYVTGINQQNQNMLFSTGCSTGINISFSGVNSGAASGFLNMSLVNISGIYGTGINAFNIVGGYIALNSGSGYQNPPIVIWGTGTNCYSVPDASGFNYAQFQKVSGLKGSVLSHAYGLTGLPLTSTINNTGFRVTGLQITNIGYGYNNYYPPTISFQRWTGDSSTNNASGTINYKSTGLYNFTGFWNISYNFLNSSNNFLTGYNTGAYYSGNITMPSGNSVLNFKITLTNLDNTTPISGLLTLSVPYFTGVLLDTKNIIQTRFFNLNTGALYNFSPPLNPFLPVTNFNPTFTGNQNGLQYQNDFNNL